MVDQNHTPRQGTPQAMSQVYIKLLGNFAIMSGNESTTEFLSGKRRAVFCHLLINHDRVLSREVVASVHWPDYETAASKKYLRTMLWRLRNELNTKLSILDALQINAMSVCLNTGAQIWLDVAEFERAYDIVKKVKPDCLDQDHLVMIKAAVDLYTGDLLPSLYDEWCLYERERLYNMYLLLLDKILARCESEHDCHSGRHYGSLLLHCNPLCELTYQRLMRLHYIVGDRAGALAIYNNCVHNLQKHLSVEPSKITIQLYQQIRSGTWCGAAPASPLANLQASAADVVGHLSKFPNTFSRLEERLSSNKSWYSKPHSGPPHRYDKALKVVAQDSIPQKKDGPRDDKKLLKRPS